MNEESRERLKEAARYQKKAIQALIPEQVADHLEVIERELKEIMLELAMEVVKEHTQNRPEEREEMVKSKKATVRKVEIG